MNSKQRRKARRKWGSDLGRMSDEQVITTAMLYNAVFVDQHDAGRKYYPYTCCSADLGERIRGDGNSKREAAAEYVFRFRKTIKPSNHRR